jgi:toxin-antitoxin system PIN domain toxin
MSRSDTSGPRDAAGVMRALLDINILLALLDGDHVDHVRAHVWLEQQIADGWASCAITENGFVRIISQPRYPSPVSPAEAIALLGEATAGDDHGFWSCDVSVLDERVVNAARLLGPRPLTDAYLLALAVAHEGTFATFDQTVSRAAVHGAAERHLTVI